MKKQIQWFPCTFILVLVHLIGTQPFTYPVVNISTTWTNNDECSISSTSFYIDNSTIRAILQRGGTYPSAYACGFYCNDVCDSFLFAVFILILNSSGEIDTSADPRVVWSANRNNPVKLNSELQLTQEGDLVLRDVDGTLAWSTNTSGKGVAGLNMTENGNLVLFGANKSVVWQSFDQKDSLLPGKRLFQGQMLTSGTTDTNWTQGISGVTSTKDVPRGRKHNYSIGSIAGSILLKVAIVWVIVHIIRKRRNNREVDEDYLDNVPGIPCRISYEELKLATQNFNKKLGQGGFGSVFEGILVDGTRVAVKCLDGIGQVKKSFLAEVESIGSIHHVNLVRLVGFAAEKSQRLLVYEYMTNGSLDKWIYQKNSDIILDWKCRRKIILDIAKGLQYLHEDCRQKIIHLDVKPQNILLDESFNAKLSDFGLSKLIDRDQTQVITTMKGTPGYLAPEWLSAVITEKVDVYSFGVVVLEILCGRKGFEFSRPEEERHLLSLFKKSAEEGRMLDLVDKQSEDMQSHGEEVVEMMQLSAWCLLSDYTKRPSMSVVVKVLEGSMEREKHIDYNLLNFQTSAHRMPQEIVADTTPLLASILSAPR